MIRDILKQPGAILLMSCYELGHQPLGLAIPMAFLGRAGFRARPVDIPIEGIDEDVIRAARFIGISVPMHTALRLGVHVARRVRTVNPGCHICFYGLYAVLNSEYLLADLADSVVGGECEDTLVALIRAIDEGETPDIPGVGRPGIAPIPRRRRLDFPVPDRSLLPPLDQYARMLSHGEERLAGYVEATRGCKHHCLHCPIPPVYDGRFYAVPRDIVLEDVGRLVEAGARHITFGDPDFLNGPTHSLRIARSVHAEHPDLTFDFTAKVEHLIRHRDLMSEFAELGCVFVVSAVESLSDRVLSHLDKGHVGADVPRVVESLRRVGIALRPTFVSFTPWTSLEDYVDVLDFVEEEGLVDHVDPIQYAIRLLIPPGSPLLGCGAVSPFLEGFFADDLSYRWSHPDPRMDELHRKVTGLVEAAAGSAEDEFLTFLRIRDLAFEVQGRPAFNDSRFTFPRLRFKPPRMTEPWFC